MRSTGLLGGKACVFGEGPGSHLRVPPSRFWLEEDRRAFSGENERTTNRVKVWVSSIAKSSFSGLRS